jgi:hypothetical protein
MAKTGVFRAQTIELTEAMAELAANTTRGPTDHGLPPPHALLPLVGW